MLNATRQEEVNEIAKAASISAEIASSNISKYLDLHSVSRAGFDMKARNLMLTEMEKVVDASVELAAKNLQVYLKDKSQQ